MRDQIVQALTAHLFKDKRLVRVRIDDYDRTFAKVQTRQLDDMAMGFEFLAHFTIAVAFAAVLAGAPTDGCGAAHEIE